MQQRVACSAIRVRMLDRRNPLVAEILVEAATEGDVEKLLPAADAERGQVVGKRPACESQLGPVTRRLDDIEVVDRRFAVLFGRDVGAAGEDDPIESLVDGPQPIVVFEDRDEDWSAAGGRKRPYITLVDPEAGRLGTRRDRQRGQTDEWVAAQLVKVNALR